MSTTTTTPELSAEEARIHADIYRDRVNGMQNDARCIVGRFAMAQQVTEKEAWKLLADFAAQQAR